jgi:hypothetical protein
MEHQSVKKKNDVPGQESICVIGQEKYSEGAKIQKLGNNLNTKNHS